MSSIRQSFIYSIESKFGGGKATSAKWLSPPPGSMISTTHNRSGSRIDPSGSKFFEGYRFGPLSGSWEWSFLLDYNYLEPLYLAFEGYEGFKPATYGVNTGDRDKITCKAKAPATGSANVDYTAASILDALSEEKSTACTGVEKDAQGKLIPPDTTVHVFYKKDCRRPRSFTIMRKKLNAYANSTDSNVSDEVEVYKGCVVKTVRMSRSSSEAPWKVSLSGFYADEEIQLGHWDETDYQPYTPGGLVEHACLVKDKAGMYSVEQVSLAIENDLSPYYAICSPIAKEFTEGRTSCSVNVTSYANNPDRWALNLYGGGTKANTGKTSDNLTTYTTQLRDLRPLDRLRIVSCATANEEDNIASVPAGITAPNGNTFTVLVNQAVIRSMTWPNGNGDKLQDNVSAECRDLAIVITCPGKTLRAGCMFYGGTHTVTPAEPNKDATAVKDCT